MTEYTPEVRTCNCSFFGLYGLKVIFEHISAVHVGAIITYMCSIFIFAVFISAGSFCSIFGLYFMCRCIVFNDLNYKYTLIDVALPG